MRKTVGDKVKNKTSGMEMFRFKAQRSNQRRKTDKGTTSVFKQHSLEPKNKYNK